MIYIIEWDDDRDKWHVYVDYDNGTTTIGYYKHYSDAVKARDDYKYG